MASEEENQIQHFVECALCQEPVSFYCRRCGVNLCDHCLPIHVRMKSKNGHEVVDYVSKDDDNGTYFCDSHPKNECSAYCQTCNVPICMLCVSIKHKSHQISELSDKIKELLKVIAEENERLQSFKHELETILEHTTKILSSMSSIYKQKKDEVTSRGEELHKEIEKIVKKLHQELDDLQKEHEDLLKKQEAKYVEVIKSLDKINRKAAGLQKSHDVKEMQTLIPLIEKQGTLTEFTQYSFPTFHECKTDANCLQTYFGYVEKIQEKKWKVNELWWRKILEVPTVIFFIDTGFPANEKDESRLYDMAVTDDNKVWMGGNSSELKLFDLYGHLYHTVNITVEGWYICMYNKQVVYSDVRKYAVKKIFDDDTVVTMFNTGHWVPHGITSTASGDLLVCLQKKNLSKVVRYINTGTVLQDIQYDSQGQPLYAEARYITENVNGDIIVTDRGKQAVIVVDKLGMFRFSYSGISKKITVGSVVNDSAGQIFITGFGSKNIHILNRDGKFLRYIMPDGGLDKPRAVCIIGHGELMVGECLTGLAKRIKY